MITAIPSDVTENFEIREWKHASAILQTDFPNEYEEILAILRNLKIKRSHVLAPGGGKSKVVQAIDKEFYHRGWEEKKWHTKIVVDQHESESPTHKVDCYKNKVALELEWSNKDPFFDRDLNNFRLLFDLRVISVGVIITKCDEFRGIFETLNVWSKYGTSTTWMSKLIPRVEGGGGGGCPVLVFGIKTTKYVED